VGIGCDCNGTAGYVRQTSELRAGQVMAGGRLNIAGLLCLDPFGSGIPPVDAEFKGKPTCA